MGVEFINTFLYVEIDLFALIILIFLLMTSWGCDDLSVDDRSEFL